jgi:hypothetical protein
MHTFGELLYCILFAARPSSKIRSRFSSQYGPPVFRSNLDEFDPAITNYTMPELSGPHFAREVLSIRPDMPIALCTGTLKKITPDSVKKFGVELL